MAWSPPHGCFVRFVAMKASAFVTASFSEIVGMECASCLSNSMPNSAYCFTKIELSWQSFAEMSIFHKLHCPEVVPLSPTSASIAFRLFEVSVLQQAFSAMSKVVGPNYRTTHHPVEMAEVIAVRPNLQDGLSSVDVLAMHPPSFAVPIRRLQFPAVVFTMPVALRAKVTQQPPDLVSLPRHALFRVQIDDLQ